ncbi:MAG: leucine-rich repeat domain-containing protein [Lachnospiraceae bacterium]|nr:leucine-rich repeat domain-containing protein [Lachnospiraceae bacterium]
MNKEKKLIRIGLVLLVLLFAFTACGKDTDSSDEAKKSSAKNKTKKEKVEEDSDEDFEDDEEESDKNDGSEPISADWGNLHPCFMEEYYIDYIDDKKLDEIDKDDNRYTIFERNKTGKRYAAVEIGIQYSETQVGEGSTDIEEEIEYEGEMVPVIYLYKINLDITEYEVPDHIWQISSQAFKRTALESITLNEGLAVIDDYALSADSGLWAVESIYIPSTVKEIEYCGFYNMRNLKSVEFADNIKIDCIEGSLFGNCRSLESIKIPDSVKKIDWGAFEFCESLKEITIPKSVTEVNAEVFLGCTSLEKVTFEDPEGWKMSVRKQGEKDFPEGESVDLSDPRKNAELLYMEDYDCDDIKLIKE